LPPCFVCKINAANWSFLINHEIEQAERGRGEGSAVKLDVPRMTAPISYSLANGVINPSGTADGAHCRLRSITG
jgi:hypothetical protein